MFIISLYPINIRGEAIINNTERERNLDHLSKKKIKGTLSTWLYFYHNFGYTEKIWP